ncbi:hypothetical protein [Corynebacterium ulcerans]|uniref:hypothetical protein n=1 Tax=Corynebacterium ulcerans TaxID=65058 RepID=UPI00051F8606|nr:hypothetical protein [Corynebacterium ulcerans]AIT89189.1 Hypothetical protein Cul210932_1243 [Corynebacterium ulcerans]ALD94965.1 Hypothetical protein Cul131001_1261 [Corynebacterium ulcerans]
MASAIKLNVKQLKELKKLHKLSDIELAKHIGVSRKTLGRAMDGENVSAAFVAGACLYFRTPFETLFHATPMRQVAAA